MPKISFDHVNVSYHEKKKKDIVVFDDLTASFEDGKINVILGESGSGKTTLLKTLTDGVDYDGKIFFDDADIGKIKVKNRNISYVSQEYSLYPDMNVFDNIAFPLRLLKAPIDEIKERVIEIAKEFQIEMCLTRKPRHISGGQQQRVAIARALVKMPSVCLLDEPLSNVDEMAASKIIPLIRETLSKREITSLYVTHNLREAMLIADKIYLMEEGKFVFIGTPYEASNSDNPSMSSLVRAYFGERKEKDDEEKEER